MKNPEIIANNLFSNQEDNQESDAALQLQQKYESNARSYPKRIPINIVKAKGVYVTDSEGKTYLDCLAGAGTLALGHNHPEVIDAIQSVINSGQPLHTLDLMTPTKQVFIETLLDTLPLSFKHNVKIHFCGPTGADAVEAAIKLCKTKTQLQNILAFQGAYHGMTFGTLSLMGNVATKAPLNTFMSDVHFLPYPYNYRCPFGLGKEQGVEVNKNFITRTLNDPESGLTKPAAMILEPIQGEGGAIVAPNDWLAHIRMLTQEHNIPLILDEVQCGMGRSGKMFAFEHANIAPDVLVLSKALGGGLPLSVIVYKSELDTWDTGAHTGTFRGNVLALAAGTKTMQILNQKGFLADVAHKGQRFLAHLNDMKKNYHCIGDVRGRGLMLGVEIVATDSTPDNLGARAADSTRAKRIQQACLRRGLILELGGRHGSTLRLLPPLIITEQEIDTVATRLEEAIKETDESGN